MIYKQFNDARRRQTSKKLYIAFTLDRCERTLKQCVCAILEIYFNTGKWMTTKTVTTCAKIPTFKYWADTLYSVRGHCLVNTVLLRYWLTELNISLLGISIQHQTHDRNLLLLYLGAFTMNLCTSFFLGGGEIMGDFLLTPVFVTRASAENTCFTLACFGGGRVV